MSDVMDRTERFYKINELLRTRRVVPRDMFLEKLEVSLATFKRDLEYLRDRMGAPIEWDRELGGYRFDDVVDDHHFELPGLWFNDTEIHALLVMENLLEDIEPGLLKNHIKPLKTQIRAIMGSTDQELEEIRKRIRLIAMGARRYRLPEFEGLCVALFKRYRVKILHYQRLTGDSLERIVSPQRLVHYRDNWYLDAWCHLRNGLRTFSVDAIREVETLKTKAKNVSDKKLDDELTSGYGIFSGKNTKTAVLRFSPVRARWISREISHPKQKSKFDKDGYYILEFPFSDERELVMDILKHGEHVEVLKPASLKKAVITQLNRTLSKY